MSCYYRGMNRSPYDDEEAASKYLSGESLASIGQDVGADPTTIMNRLESYGVARRPKTGRRKYDLLPDFFSVISCEKQAYFLGLLFADGCNHGKYVSISLADRDLVIACRDLIYPNKDRPISTYPGSLYHGHRGKDRHVLLISSRSIACDLKKLGMVERKSLVLEFPAALSPELNRHFIRGYFDGDGCLSLSADKSANMYIRSSWRVLGTMQFIGVVGEIINAELGIRASIRSSRSVFELCISGNRQVHRTCSWMYQDATIFLQRKYDRYKNLVDIQSRRRKVNYGR